MGGGSASFAIEKENTARRMTPKIMKLEKTTRQMKALKCSVSFLTVTMCQEAFPRLSTKNEQLWLAPQVFPMSILQSYLVYIK